VRPRTTLLLPFVALLGAAALAACAAAPQALAAPSEVKLEVNDNCEVDSWACWAASGSTPKAVPESEVTIVLEGKVKFVDNAHAATVSWLGTAPTMCSGIPASATTGWEGTCTFETLGTYHFESSTLFNDGVNNYTKYEVVVVGTPKAKTTPTSPQHQTEATLAGSIEPEGNPTEYHFDYGSASITEHSSAPTSLGAADFTSHSVSLPVSDLSPGTEYHFELIVSYGAGQTVPGGPQTFTTPPATKPTVSTLAASALKETEATLNGKVDPEGGTQAEYFFEWGAGSSGAYQHTTKAVSLPSDGAEHQAATTVTGLAPSSEYHFRLVAKNALGSVQGTDLTFMAASTPPAQEPTKEPPAQEPTKEPSAKEPSPTPTPTGGGPTATTTSSPSSGQPTIEPASGPLFGSLELASSQHGGVVHGSLVVSSAGAEGRLQIELLTKGAAAAVGKFLRSPLHAGKLTFALPLSARAKHTLKSHHRLALTVQIALTPVHGSAVRITRSVVLHA
jgi:hypothetical protein